MSDYQAFCTQCGTALHGAKFCPECGAETANAGQEPAAANGDGGGTATIAPSTATQRVVPVAPPRAHRRPKTDGPSKPPRSRRRLLLAAAGGALVLGLIVAGVALFAGGGSKTVTRVVVTTPPHTSASTTTSQTTTTSVGPVTRGEARALANAYAAAYSAESVSTLRGLLAPGFHRVNAGEPAQDRTAALDTYARQFKDLTDPHYALSGIAITTGQDTASVAADYQITSSAGTVKGSVVIEMGRVNGKLMITSIKATPQTPSGSGSSSGGGSSGSGSSGSSSSGGGSTNGGSSSGGSSSGGSSSGQSGSDGGGLGWYGNELPIAPVPNLY